MTSGIGHIDPKVQRTRNRPLAARSLSVGVGLVVALVSFVCAWGLSLYLNPLTFWLCVAAVPVIVLYPGAKRVFPVPQLVLGRSAWGFAVLISWSAVSCGATPAATSCLGDATWLLWGATVLWTLGFDTIYAMSDREDDRRIGINSSALFFGQFAPHAIGLFLAGTVGLLAGVGVVMALKLGFWLGLGLATIAWGWQYSRLCQKTIASKTYAQLVQAECLDWICAATRHDYWREGVRLKFSAVPPHPGHRLLGDRP